MNTDKKKNLINYYQIESNNTSRRLYTKMKWNLFQGCKMAQHMQINKHNTSHQQHQQTERQKQTTVIISTDPPPKKK